MDFRKKYIELIIKKCICSDSKSLFIRYDKSNSQFIDDLIICAKENKFEDIIIDENDKEYELELLKTLSIEELKKHPYFKRKNWNKAIDKNCVFLLTSSPTPHFFDAIDKEKLKIVNDLKTEYMKKYLEYVMQDKISWTIFALPNIIWAKSLFPSCENAYQKLESLIYNFCMIDKSDNPIEEWDKLINIENQKVRYLNNLKINSIQIKNKIGTNLTISLVDDYLFRSLELKHCIENMPTYSIWSAPHKYKVDGIVVGSIPITYLDWNIEEYWFKFSNGKVVEYDALKGKEYLNYFFSKGDSYKRLGEIALIDYNSPISKTNCIYNCNLFDENISTHLALGSAYQNTIKNGLNMNQQQLEALGCNICPEHMDFCIGTSDLEITIETKDKQKIKIFKNGNFDYNLINTTSPFE